MLSWLFKKKKHESDNEYELAAPVEASWAFLGADMHSHFVPGIDDGAKTVEDSIALIQAMIAMGYKKIITTPHVMIDFYPNTTETIQQGLRILQDALQERQIDIPVRAAAEYYIDEHFMKLLDTEPLLTIHNNEVLVEFSMLYQPPMLFDAIFRMQSAGYKPIIAHPERYMFFHNETRKYRELKDRGCLMQMNLLAIAGYYGKNVKVVAEDLMAKGIYDYCGSDMHHEKHAAALKALALSKSFHSIIGYPFLNSRLCAPST